MSDLQITIQSNPSKPVDTSEEGRDTSILTMDDRWYVEIDGKPSLLFQPFARFLRTLFERQAADLGRLLHHADVVISGDRDLVREKALARDGCNICRKACDQAMALMDSDPGVKFIVGTLYWTAS
jgi:hypothetical protein